MSNGNEQQNNDFVPSPAKGGKPNIFKKICAGMSILQICDCHTVMVILHVYNTAYNAYQSLIHIWMFFT
jgi:hypothetical protein